MGELPKIYLLFLEIINAYIPFIFLMEKNLYTHLDNIRISLGVNTNKTL